MTIHGFQKLTLLDFPGHVACTVFTAGCNLRCPFCHNALLVTDIQPGDRIAEEDVLSYLAKRKGLLDGVAVTGGEPLLQPDLPEFLKKLRDLGYAVKLDTNGCFPDRLRAVLDAGLADYVAMDVKNAPDKYARTVGVESFDLTPVRESIELLLSGAVECEFRTTVVAELHTARDIREIAEWLRGAKRYFLQNFVDSGGLIGEGLHAPKRDDLFAMLDEARKTLPSAALRGVD